jgi:hypothetical protein
VEPTPGNKIWLIKLIRTRAVDHREAVGKEQRRETDLCLLRGAKALAEEIMEHYVPRPVYDDIIEKLELNADLTRKLEQDWNRHVEMIRRLEEDNSMIRMALAAKVLEKDKEAE